MFWRTDAVEPRQATERFAIEAFRHTIESESPTAHHLGPGDAILIDNHSVLHGRTTFSDYRRLHIRVRLWEHAKEGR